MKAFNINQDMMDRKKDSKKEDKGLKVVTILCRKEWANKREDSIEIKGYRVNLIQTLRNKV